MAKRTPDPKEVGRYFALAMVGMEMVVPVGVGYWLDRSFGWSPWGATVGAVLGLTVGLFHLVTLAKQFNRNESGKKTRDQP